jgi:hypothetical protein
MYEATTGQGTNTTRIEDWIAFYEQLAEFTVETMAFWELNMSASSDNPRFCTRTLLLDQYQPPANVAWTLNIHRLACVAGLTEFEVPDILRRIFSVILSLMNISVGGEEGLIQISAFTHEHLGDLSRRLWTCISKAREWQLLQLVNLVSSQQRLKREMRLSFLQGVDYPGSSDRSKLIPESHVVLWGSVCSRHDGWRSHCRVSQMGINREYGCVRS